MNDDLIKAIIALIRADTDVTVGLNTRLGGRIYEASQVPATTNGAPTPFPRCYINERRGPRWTRFNRSDGGTDRIVPIEILFASNTATSPSAAFDIKAFDRRARSLVEYNVTKDKVPGIVWFMRTQDIENLPQADDITTYIVGGGLYEALIQEG